MGYFYLLCVALLFSFGGTCVKLIKPYFGAGYITFFRFAIGVCVLLLLKLILRIKKAVSDGSPAATADKAAAGQVIRARQLAGWIVFGAVGKWLAYLTENYALSRGPSYGNIITQPAQTIFLTLSSVLLFRDKLSPRKVFCIFLCMLGVLGISWNGRSMDAFFHENASLTLLFLFSGVCAGAHVLAQKMIADRMDIVDSNLCIFAVSAVLAAIPLVPETAGGALAGVRPNLPCLLAILLFGSITGIGFYLNAKAIPLVPFYMVPVIQSTMAIFALLWGVLFFHESITWYLIGGTALFLAGLIGLQLKGHHASSPSLPASCSR